MSWMMFIVVLSCITSRDHTEIDDNRNSEASLCSSYFITALHLLSLEYIFFVCKESQFVETSLERIFGLRCLHIQSVNNGLQTLRVCRTRWNEQKTSHSTHLQTSLSPETWMICVFSLQQALCVVPTRVDATSSSSSRKSAFSLKNFWVHANRLTSIL